MEAQAARDIPEDGRLVANIVHFVRALRAAGLPVGTGRTVDAIRAVALAGFTSREDFFWTLHASLVSRREHSEVFRQVFRLYWRDPRYLEHMMSLLLPSVRGVQPERQAAPAERRAAEALLDGARDRPGPELEAAAEDMVEIEVDAAETGSAEERLRTLDFELMTGAEMAAARRMLARLGMPVRPMPARRSIAHPAGRIPDWRRTLADAARRGGEVDRLRMKRRRERWPALVAICDISGSMSAYSRAVLHFLHSLANAGRRHGTATGARWSRVHAFTFGTRLTNITRHLENRDVDVALAAAGAEAQDWQGGTRIGECLHAFNRDWSRRVLTQGAVVLLISDGLDRGDPAVLEAEMERLHLSCRRLVWVNPLLRWAEFAPRARGIAAMLPHVDSFRAGHNVASLEALAEALSNSGDRGELDRMRQLVAASDGGGAGADGALKGGTR